MRIGIDARELCGHATGVGRYLSGLLAEWTKDAHGHEFVLYAPEEISQTLDGRTFARRRVSGVGGTVWEQIALPKAIAADRLDVWFAPAYTAPLRLDLPVVLAVHDLSFFARPEWFTVREGVRRRWMTARSAAAAARVITISNFSKRELMDRLNVAADRIEVIPPGISRQSPVGSHQSQSSAPRVLFVGSLFTRRHVPDLIRAFAPIARRRPDAALDIAGDNRTYPRVHPRVTIAHEGIVNQVDWHAYVTDTQLRDLYGKARAFAFLSEYEGLGLTPLEALAAGLPPVLIDTPVARESCEDAALYVPVGNLRATTEALERALFDEPLRQQILSAAPAILAKYRWREAAERTLGVLERCSRS